MSDRPEFEWPCDLRIAHGRHEVPVKVGENDWEVRDCGGVPAHPDTMIGGATA